MTAPTKVRTMIAALLPRAAYGDTLPLLRPSAGVTAAEYVALAPLLLANLCAMSFDYLVRQKVQGRQLKWFVVEQLPVIVPEKFAQPLPAKFLTAMRKAQLMNGHHANPTVADFVIPQVLALSYTAHDLAPFARDLGCVDAEAAVLPPFVWDEDKPPRVANFACGTTCWHCCRRCPRRRRHQQTPPWLRRAERCTDGPLPPSLKISSQIGLQRLRSKR